MRKLIILGLMAATAAPTLVSAQTQELRRDRRDLQEEQRELRDARRHGDRRDIREERRDVRGARRELREDRRDWARNDWRSYRNQNRRLYSRGTWRAPFRHQVFRPGIRLRPAFYNSRYFIADPWRYHLPPAIGSRRWVRHYDDLLLVDIRRGVVIDVIRNFFW